jgi:hypothetical protein
VCKYLNVLVKNNDSVWQGLCKAAKFSVGNNKLTSHTWKDVFKQMTEHNTEMVKYTSTLSTNYHTPPHAHKPLTPHAAPSHISHHTSHPYLPSHTLHTHTHQHTTHHTNTPHTTPTNTNRKKKQHDTVSDTKNGEI